MNKRDILNIQKFDFILFISLLALLLICTVIPVSAGTGWTITGTVTDNVGDPISGVAVSTSAGYTTYTDASGNYTLSSLSSGSYVLSATKTGYTFSPITLSVTVSGNLSGQNFTGSVVGSFTTCAAVGGLPARECEALVALYDSTDGVNWGMWLNESWKQTNAPCTWEGVTCTAGHVTQLALSGDEIKGTLPPELGNLVNLTNLRVNWTEVSGSLPPELGNLTNLTILDLQNNQLSGSLPPELGNLTNLRQLHLDGNQLSGSLPAEFGDLTNLNFIRISNNELSGSLPLTLVKLNNLYIFNYNQTGLCAPSTPEFQDWLTAISEGVIGTGVTCGGEVGSFPKVVIDSRDGVFEGQQFSDNPIELQVKFSETMLNDSSDHSANSLQNYMLLQPGLNRLFDTPITSPSICNIDHIPVGDDINIPISNVSYNPSTNIASLMIENNFSPLIDGSYRLYICGAASIWDLNDLPINGGKNGEVNFTVGLSQISNYGTLPNTGFAPDIFTLLPVQPPNLKYHEYFDFPRRDKENQLETQHGLLQLEIPKIGLSNQIVGVPIGQTSWDLTWLNNQIGYLEGTAFPTWNGNSTLTAHVVMSNGLPGPFSKLNNLRFGDPIIIHAWGKRYLYEVRTNEEVSPNDLGVLRHENYPWLTLLTCSQYDETERIYLARTAVRAVLIEVEDE